MLTVEDQMKMSKEIDEYKEKAFNLGYHIYLGLIDGKSFYCLFDNNKSLLIKAIENEFDMQSMDEFLQEEHSACKKFYQYIALTNQSEVKNKKNERIL